MREGYGVGRVKEGENVPCDNITHMAVAHRKEEGLVHCEPAVNQGNFVWLQHWVSDTAVVRRV